MKKDIINYGNDPFEVMYKSFRLFNESSNKWKRDFVPMSAGINWIKTNPLIQELLKAEIQNDLSTRNYGNAAGTHLITRLLQYSENKLFGLTDIHVTLTNGATEGAHIVLDNWIRRGVLNKNDKAIVIGHTFGFYYKLCKFFSLRYNEILVDKNNKSSFLPSTERIMSELLRVKPSIIFLLFPNNPFGELINISALKEIAKYVINTNSKILLDKVCLMPWDDISEHQQIIGKLVSSGHAVSVDSLSKSQGIAGLRVGFLSTNGLIKKQIIEHTKSRSLNPIVFGTPTMALARLCLIDLQYSKRVGDLVRKSQGLLFSEYPYDESFDNYFQLCYKNIDKLSQSMEKDQLRIKTNLKVIRKIFSCGVRPINLTAGFNVVVSTDKMKMQNELNDQIQLSKEFGIGVLTSSCFCELDSSSHYFIRFGLSLDEQTFENTLLRINDFYKEK